MQILTSFKSKKSNLFEAETVKLLRAKAYHKGNIVRRILL